MANMLTSSSDQNSFSEGYVSSSSTSTKMGEFPAISHSLKQFLAQRRERSYKWYEEHDLQSLNKLPPLKALTNKTSIVRPESDKNMLWTSVFEVFFEDTDEKNRRYSRDNENDNAMSYLVPSKLYMVSKDVGVQHKKATKTKPQSKKEAVSEIIADLKSMNMTDEVKKIEELVKIKNKTDLALRKMEEKDKEMEKILQKQQFYNEYLNAKQEEKKKRIREERRLKKRSHSFVAGFAADNAKRNADAVVSKQKNQSLWNKTFKAALKSRLEL